jgi:Nitrogen regulatory protein P-II
MKIVMGIIKPFKLNEVRDALTGVHEIIVTEVRGYERQKDQAEILPWRRICRDLAPKKSRSKWRCPPTRSERPSRPSPRLRKPVRPGSARSLFSASTAPCVSARL